MTIIKQGNIYHAELKVPGDVREIIGQNKFRKSLQTTDIKEAKRKEPIIVSAWKEKIEIARGNGGDIRQLAQQYREASDEAKDALEDVFQDMVADDYGKVHYSDLSPEQSEKAFYKYEILTGKIIQTNILLKEWLDSWGVNQKGKEQGQRFVEEFCKEFPATRDVTKQSLFEWCSFMMEVKELTKKTISCRLSPCKMYWQYLQIKGYVDPDKNPFTNLRLTQKSKSKKNNSREEFSIDEINQLSKEIKKKSNSDPELSHLFQIAIYTGARIEEICKIKKSDVGKESIKITDSKTSAGIREVPIHNQLTGLIKELKNSPEEKYLISNLVPNKFGERSASIGKRFGRLKKGLGFDSTKVFHSIRRTVITQLEQAGVSESVTADIVGHDKKTITYGLYSGGSSLKQKLEAINKISYD